MMVLQCFNENENYDNILDEIAERSLKNEENDEIDDVLPLHNYNKRNKKVH